MGKSHAIRAGEAFVEMYTDDKRVLMGLKRLRRTFGRFGQQIGSSVNNVGYKLLGLGLVVNAALLASVAAASRVEASFTRLDLLFGSMAGSAESFVQQIAAATGRTGLFIRESLNSFQAFFQGLDFGKEVAFDLARAMTQLQQDFASVTGQSSDESMRRFIAALAGSPEVLDQFGIDLKEMSLQAVLAAHGIDSLRKASEKQKTLARMVLIFDRLGKQGGINAAVKTMTKFATILDLMKGSAIEATAAIGMQLKPAFIVISEAIRALGPFVKRFIEQNGQLILSFAKATALAIGLAGGLLVLGTSLRLIGFALGGIGLLFTLPGLFAGLVTTVASVVTSLLGIPAALGGLLISATTVFGTLLSFIPPILGIVATLGTLVLVTKAAGVAMEADWGGAMRRVLGIGRNFARVLGSEFSALFELITRTWRQIVITFRIGVQGILSAMQGGDIQLASEILTAAIELGWQVMINNMTDAWQSFITYWSSSIERFKEKLTDLWEDSALKRFELKAKNVLETLRINLDAAFPDRPDLVLTGTPEAAGTKAEYEARTAKKIREQRLLESLHEAERFQNKLNREKERDRKADQYYQEVVAPRIAEKNARDAELQRRKQRLFDLQDRAERLSPKGLRPVQSMLDQFNKLLAESIQTGVAESLDALGVQTGLGSAIIRGLTGEHATQKDIADNTKDAALAAAENVKATREVKESIEHLAPSFSP